MSDSIITNNPLFMGCTEDELNSLMQTLSHRKISFSKGAHIYHEGQIVTDIGIVLSGSVQIENIDILGNKSILGISNAGDIFAEAYACIPGQPLLVDVVARENSEIMFLNVPSLFTSSGKDGLSNKLLRNLLRITSKKNVNLSMRIFHSAPKKIRARLVSYFSEQTRLQNSNVITIPLDRQQLADYLGVERTALSKELGKMREEGLISFYKNQFTLIALTNQLNDQY